MRLLAGFLVLCFAGLVLGGPCDGTDSDGKPTCGKFPEPVTYDPRLRTCEQSGSSCDLRLTEGAIALISIPAGVSLLALRLIYVYWRRHRASPPTRISLSAAPFNSLNFVGEAVSPQATLGNPPATPQAVQPGATRLEAIQGNLDAAFRSAASTDAELGQGGTEPVVKEAPPSVEAALAEATALARAIAGGTQPPKPTSLMD